MISEVCSLCHSNFGNDLNLLAITDNGFTSLMVSAESGHIPCMKTIINLGIDINAMEKHGGTALIWASGNGHVEAVRLLIQSGANVNQNNNGTALMEACGNGQLECISLLLNCGANIDQQCSGDGRTALMLAACNGQKEAVKLLLDFGTGASITPISKSGKTALQYAQEENHLEIVELIRKATLHRSTSLYDPNCG